MIALPPAIALVALLAVEPAAPQVTPVTPFNETGLAALVWERSPDVIAARQDVIEGEAARARTYLLPNPTLGLTWGTIPLGARPGGVAFGDVPSYGVGISELLELGKRGPRQHASEAARKTTEFLLLETYRQAFFALLEALSNQAAATVRLAVLQRLVASSDEGLRLQRARADKGDVAALEVDRLRVEHLRLQSSLRGAQAEQEAAAYACTRIVAEDCPRFATEAEADQFLHQAAVPPAADDRALIQHRPDLEALRTVETRLRAEEILAGRLKIPDPTATLAYTRDQFISAGNQPNSLTLNLSLPLPLFDHGQVELTRTRARLTNNRRALEALETAATRSLTVNRRLLLLYQDRARILDTEALPQARDVVERTTAAARRGGVALPDVLLVRRALEELALDRVDVAAAAYHATLDVRRAAGDFPRPSTMSAAGGVP